MTTAGHIIFDKFVHVFQNVYGTITVDDCQRLVTFLKRTDVTAEQLHTKIMQHLDKQIADERATSPQEIEQVLDTYPALDVFFKSDTLWQFIDQRINKSTILAQLTAHFEQMVTELNDDANTSSHKEDSEDDDKGDDDDDEGDEDDKADREGILSLFLTTSKAFIDAVSNQSSASSCHSAARQE